MCRPCRTAGAQHCHRPRAPPDYCTATAAVAALFAELGSAVVLVTDTLSGMVAPLVTFLLTCTASVRVAVPPDARPATVQLTVPVPPTAGVVQVQPLGAVSDWKVVLAGMALVRLTA